MKKTVLAVTAAAVALGAAGLSAAKKSSEPTLMTVNGKDVPVSEFVYLYEKNKQQQAAPQSLEEYLEMFTNYKLKVAEAEATGVDTTAAFRDELAGYVSDLANPYLNDSTVLEGLERDAYARMLRSPMVSHIMLPVGRTPDERLIYMMALDSIRNLVVNGANFEEEARRNSSDRSVTMNGGSMGWVTVGKFPYPFETMAYNTPVGEVSEVFEDSPYGIHFVKVMDERENPGKVVVEHILLLTKGMPDEAAAGQKARIDSIYDVVVNHNGDFNALARQFSQDPGSAKQGGALPPFGLGQMVPEFEQVSFALADGDVSRPFATSYGWHIVRKVGSQPAPSFEDSRAEIAKMISRDERAKAPRQAKIAELRKQWGVNPSADAMNNVYAQLADSGLTPALRSRLQADWTTVAKLPDGSKVLLSDVAKRLPDYTINEPERFARHEIEKAANEAVDEAVEAYALKTLEAENPDYRNVVREYRDGILLFDVSNKNVWERATTDAEGLENYFNANRDKYRWDAPKFKGYVVSAVNDSIANAVRVLLAEQQPSIDSLAMTLKENFGRSVKVERRIMAKGDDAVVDYLAFGGEKPENGGRWTEFVSYKAELLDQPTEAADVRPGIVSDYQQWLEDRWVESLKQKYPVKVNQKELKKLLQGAKK